MRIISFTFFFVAAQAVFASAWQNSQSTFLHQNISTEVDGRSTLSVDRLAVEAGIAYPRSSSDTCSNILHWTPAPMCSTLSYIFVVDHWSVVDHIGLLSLSKPNTEISTRSLITLIL